MRAMSKRPMRHLNIMAICPIAHITIIHMPYYQITSFFPVHTCLIVHNLICSIAHVLHCLNAPFLTCHTALMPHCLMSFIAHIPSCLIALMPHCPYASLPSCFIALMPHCPHASLPSCLIALMHHCLLSPFISCLIAHMPAHMPFYHDFVTACMHKSIETSLRDLSSQGGDNCKLQSAIFS